jgi:hypothetical protein
VRASSETPKREERSSETVRVLESWRWPLLVLLLPSHIDIASRRRHPGHCVVAEEDAVILIATVEALREVEEGLRSQMTRVFGLRKSALASQRFQEVIKKMLVSADNPCPK